MLLATCVNTPIDHNVFQNLRTPVARCSASCVNWASRWFWNLTAQTVLLACLFWFQWWKSHAANTETLCRNLWWRPETESVTSFSPTACTNSWTSTRTTTSHPLMKVKSRWVDLSKLSALELRDHRMPWNGLESCPIYKSAYLMNSRASERE